MSEYYCHSCEEIIKLDRKIINGKNGLTNMAIWCHKNPIIHIQCLSEKTLQLMRDIKNNDEESHLVNWDYSKEWVKISKDGQIENSSNNKEDSIFNTVTMIGVFFILPAIMMISANYLCDYLSKQLT